MHWLPPVAGKSREQKMRLDALCAQVKSGTDTVTDLYWGSGSAIWNNAGDTAWLRDEQGSLVDSYSY